MELTCMRVCICWERLVVDFSFGTNYWTTGLAMETLVHELDQRRLHVSLMYCVLIY